MRQLPPIRLIKKLDWWDRESVILDVSLCNLRRRQVNDAIAVLQRVCYWIIFFCFFSSFHAEEQNPVHESLPLCRAWAWWGIRPVEWTKFRLFMNGNQLLHVTDDSSLSRSLLQTNFFLYVKATVKISTS